jgi:hypothetical protein
VSALAGQELNEEAHAEAELEDNFDRQFTEMVGEVSTCP